MPNAMDQLRADARATWDASGLPSTKAEAWRNFPGRALRGRELHEAPTPVAVDAAALDAFVLPGIVGLAVFVDGRFSADLSRLDGLPEGVIFGSLAAAAHDDAGPVDALLGRVHVAPTQPSHGGPDGLSALNGARFEDGLFVSVPAGRAVERPLQALFVGTVGGEGRATHVRTLVALGRSAEATVICRHVALSGSTRLATEVAELSVGENAGLDWVQVVEEGAEAVHIGAATAKLGRDARLRSFTLSLGGAVARTALRTELAGEGASCDVDGLYVGDGAQELDHYTEIDHLVPRCTSRELWGGIMDGRSVGSWQGVIYMREGATKSATTQLNRNLLLSQGASANTKPQLEIDNDDVTASHGTTVGQLDEQARYYLEARGITPDVARRMLTLAFGRDALAQVRDVAVRRALEALVAEKLGAVDVLEASELSSADDRESFETPSGDDPESLGGVP